MALSTVRNNNKLVKYTEEINFEYVRENLFSTYMGEGITSIIRVRNQMKSGGEQMNIPLVARLKGNGVSTGPLSGQEEEIDDYGCRVWVDFARNAVKTNKYQQQIDSADVFGSAKPLLSDWGKELQRDEIIEAMMALPTEAPPVGLAGPHRQSRQRHRIPGQHPGRAQHVAHRQCGSHPVRYQQDERHLQLFGTALDTIDFSRPTNATATRSR